jgi:hypothetical protein
MVRGHRPGKGTGFVSSPEVPRAKEDSGVVDKPDIYFLQ